MSGRKASCDWLSAMFDVETDMEAAQHAAHERRGAIFAIDGMKGKKRWRDGMGAIRLALARRRYLRLGGNTRLGP